MEIGSQTPGTISIPAITVKKQGIATNAVFKKFKLSPELISKINNNNLESGYNLSLSLSYLNNLTTPLVTSPKILTLAVNFGSQSISKDIEIIPYGAQGTGDVNSTIEETISVIDEYLSDPEKMEIINLLGLNLQTLKSSLLSFRSELSVINSNSSSSPQQKIQERDRIKNEVENLRKDIPKSLSIINKGSLLPSIPPTTVKDVYLPLDKKNAQIKQSILNSQHRSDIKSSAIAYRLKKFSNDVIEKTIIKRTVTTVLQNAYLIEDIPTSLASSSSKIEFNAPITAIELTPILKLPLTSGSGTLTYQLEGDVIDSLASINTIVISTDIQATDTYQKPTCGDQVCTIPLEDAVICPEDCKRKIPWTPIIITVVIFLILLYYINFYKGKYNFRSLFQKEKLFKTEADKINLINYIEKSLKHNSIDKIIKILLTKGWNKKQIDYAFQVIKKKKK